MSRPGGQCSLDLDVRGHVGCCPSRVGFFDQLRTQGRKLCIGQGLEIPAITASHIPLGPESINWFNPEA